MFSRSADRAKRRASHPDEDWMEPEKARRDWKKAFLVFGLGALSWVATYVGMLELIQSNMGNLDFGTKAVIGFSVAMLMTMIIWLLDQMFAPHPFLVKLSYITGYIFLTIISVGFGFGFYWKVLESRSEASRSAESAVGQVQASLLAGSARLDQLQGTLEQLTQISQEKAILEREKGTSCPNSRPGDGPRRRLRDDDAGRFSFASNFVKGRSAKVKEDMRGLDGDLKKISTSDASTFDKATGTRNNFLRALSRKLEMTATSFNAFRTDPQLRQIRSELAERANRSTFPTGSGSATFSCPDGQLQSALLGVVRAIDQLPELGKPEIATVEGAQAVVEAFRRLTATGAGLLTFKLPPSADELRALQTQAVRSVSPGAASRRTSASASGLSQGGLSQRDYIPLSIAAFVDLCLLLVSIGRPMNRLGGLVPKMREAERGPVYQILSKFDDIHRDQKVREKFEVFRHVVFDFNGDYYVAVPLDAPRNRNPDEVKNLQLEAHLLSNLFASFEKEKIFSRVYNPLLSRKVIQKKLWRQGSKFAGSQAFRTYRFRDGAWSDIILGAVMGAARRAHVDRVRQAEEAGPQLDLPSTLPANAEEARAREIIAATVGEQTADVKSQLKEGPFIRTEGAGYDPDAAQIAAAFGPYADRMSVDRRERAEAKQVHAPMTWPYRKPPTPPGEAEVDLMPANSNTTPNQRPNRAGTWNVGDAASSAAGKSERSADNVILMPLPVAQPNPSGVSDGEPRNSAVGDFGVEAGSRQAPLADAPSYGEMPGQNSVARAISVEPEEARPAEVAKSDELGILPAEQTVRERQMPPPLPQSAPIKKSMEASMNVRITQRTADFQIPMSATSNGQPIEFVKAGIKTAFMAMPHENEDRDQLALDFQNNDPVPLEAEVFEVEANEEGVRSKDNGVFLLHAPEDLEEIDGVSFTTTTRPAENNSARFTDDDLEEISRRFAPNRRGE